MPPRKRQNVEPPAEDFDPFGSESDEAQVAIEDVHVDWDVAHETVDTETDASKNVKVINVGSEGKFVGTIKGGRDFDEPWIVMHCDSLQELVDNLTNRELLGKAMDAAQQASKKFRELRPVEETTVAQNSSQNGSQPRAQGRPAAATEGPWGVQTCPHGTMTFKSGQSDDGSVWQGYFCPAPKGAPNRCAKNKYVR